MGDLFRQLKKRRVLPEHQVRDVVLQLIVAVAGLHRNNICHRDIKPENILLERSQLNLRGVVLMVSFPSGLLEARVLHATCFLVYCFSRIRVSFPLDQC